MNSQDAYDFYIRFIYDAEKVSKMEQYNFPTNGVVHSIMWECFAAILLGLTKRLGFGPDLDGWEIKSASDESSAFEYQYHRNTGIAKLEEDMLINHMYITYGNTYKNVTVRSLNSNNVKPLMEPWKQLLTEWYKVPDRQRFRVSIKRPYVEQYGQVLLKIVDKKLVT